MRKKPIDFFNNYSGLIAFFTALATLATAFATFSSVNEMKEARNQLYKPCIIFEHSSYTNKYKDYESFTYVHEHNFTFSDFDRDDNGYIPNLKFAGYNIGEGVATDLEITFKFDNYNEFVEKISEEYPSIDIEIIDDGFIYHPYIDIDKRRSKIVHYKSTEGIEYKKLYLRPDDKMTISLPKEFCKLLYIIAGCKIEEQFIFNPTIDFHIKYDDVQGITYNEDYKVRVNINVESISEIKYSDANADNTDESNTDFEDYLYNVVYEIEPMLVE